MNAPPDPDPTRSTGADPIPTDRIPTDRIPTDLAPGEEGLVRWFSDSTETSAPAAPPEELETLVLDACAEEVDGSVVGGPVSGRRSRAWHGALPAILLVLVGVVGLVWAARGAARRAQAVRADVLPPPPVVVDDPTVPLYPGMETFGGSGDGEREDGGPESAPGGVR